MKGYPYRVYSSWVQGKGWNKYYTVEGYRPLLLGPDPIEEIPSYKEDFAQLWNDFPLVNTKVPLPVRHPLFRTVPLMDLVGESKTPTIGISIFNPNHREISRLYTLPGSFSYDYSQSQELFKLPYVRNRILKFSQDKIWKDLFSMKIQKGPKSPEAMIYDLYILQIRSKLFPKNIIRYGLVDQDRAIMEVETANKDYLQEVILTNSGGNIYSYLLRTEKNSEESLKLRAKFLNAIVFVPVDPDFGKILYTEFKALNFARQVDQEGMLYLFSAWTQDIDNQELLKEMIFYLERGQDNSSQLSQLYAFALKKFGKTFTTREKFSASEDPEIILQRRIELENQKKIKEAENVKSEPKIQVELSPEERMNLYLKKAKENNSKSNKEMNIN